MTLPVAPSSISFSQLACEMGNNCQNISLRTYSQCAALSSPDAISELYGKTCTSVYGIGSWSAGGSMICARYTMTGFGTQNSALTAGGWAFGQRNNVEEYNGTNWAGGGTLPISAEGNMGFGTQNEGLVTGGSTGGGAYTPVCASYEYNGSTWSTGGNLINARSYAGAAGVQNSGIVFGSPTCTELYNGSNWCAGPATTISSGRCGSGSQNSALAVGGGPSLKCTEEFNGTSWCNVNGLNVGRSYAATSGTQNSSLTSSGYINSVAGSSCTEEYNGVNWSTANARNFSSFGAAGAGSQDSGLSFGGYNGSYVASTSEYNKPFCCTVLC